MSRTMASRTGSCNGAPRKMKPRSGSRLTTPTNEGDQAKYQAASYYFKRGRDLTYPRTDGSPPFHLKETLFNRVFGKPSRNIRGVLARPNRWRREVKIGGLEAVESRIGDDRYAEQLPPGVAPLVTRVFNLFEAEFPGYAYYSRLGLAPRRCGA